MHCEGVFRVSSIQECREAITRISTGYIVDEQKVENYLAALEKVSIKGYLQRKLKRECDVPYRDNVNNLSNALYKKLMNNHTFPNVE